MLSSRGKQELKNKNINSITELFNEGLEIALTTDYPVMPFSGLLNTAIEACKNGVDEEEALKMITISAAKISGIDKRVGSIEVGKDSDLVIFDNNPFKYVSKILYTRRFLASFEGLHCCERQTGKERRADYGCRKLL